MGLLLCAFAAHASFESGRTAYLNAQYQEAREIWTRAAESGDAKAQFGLGSLYHEGRGIEGDAKKSFEWFLKSATQGYAPAQFNLGNAYQRGDGVAQSHDAANKWWREAAEQEFAPAQFNLGTQYLLGRGVPKDRTIALIFYRRAAENGHPDANRTLAMLESSEYQQSTPTSAAQSATTRTPSPSVASAPKSPTRPMTHASSASASATGWIMVHEPAQFVVQVLSGKSEKAAKAFIGRHEWPADAAIVPFERDGQTWYAAVTGPFGDRTEAKSAAQTLVANNVTKAPWIRTVESMQSLYQNR
jgi:hypothetical protein